MASVAPECSILIFNWESTSFCRGGHFLSFESWAVLGRAIVREKSLVWHVLGINPTAWVLDGQCFGSWWQAALTLWSLPSTAL